MTLYFHTRRKLAACDGTLYERGGYSARSQNLAARFTDEVIAFDALFDPLIVDYIVEKFGREGADDKETLALSNGWYYFRNECIKDARERGKDFGHMVG